MESIPVLIIGAGPSGMALGISLARYGIQSIILEKDLEIAHDPRGVVLNGDAVRIMYDLGLGKDMPQIGQPMIDFQYHKGSFTTKSFFKVDLTTDLLHQGLPTGILMSQPKFEQAMETLINDSDACDLRRGCVAETQRVVADGVVINYKTSTGTLHSIKCSWLIGADGKKGVVRKHFLEKQAGIKQEEGVYPYQGTWVAANLHIDLPAPQSHPRLPFWELGLTPQQIYDLYWPKGWHFCSPPGKPTAAGRFGSHEDRLWRHEFAESSWHDDQDAEALFWEHITPMITRQRDGSGRTFPSGPVMYPRDCIEIRRCRPYTFVHKVVNKWFANRTVLIGDAAHVFPPFAGQGICSGVRDAHQLAWRLVAILRCNSDDAVANRLLHSWAKERRQGIDDSARLTAANGQLVNHPETLAFYLSRHISEVRKNIPFIRQAEHPIATIEANGYKPTTGGFFLSSFDGGGKFPQMTVISQTGEGILSDKIFKRGGATLPALFAILSIQHGDVDAETQQRQVKTVVRDIGLPPSVLDEDAVVTFEDRPRAHHSIQGETGDNARVFSLIADASRKAPSKGDWYERGPFHGRLPNNARFVVLRPDFYIYAVAKDIEQLREALFKLQKHLQEIVV